MCIKFESRKICVAGNQHDNIDFDFHNAEHKELPVIAVTILILLILFSRVNVLTVTLRASCKCDAVHVRCSASGFFIISKFCVRSVLMSVR